MEFTLRKLWKIEKLREDLDSSCNKEETRVFVGSFHSAQKHPLLILISSKGHSQMGLRRTMVSFHWSMCE